MEKRQEGASSMRTFEVFVRLRTDPEAGSFTCTLDSTSNENIGTLQEALFLHFPDLPKKENNDMKETVSLVGHICVHHRFEVAKMHFDGRNQYPLIDEPSVRELITIYQELDLHEMIVDWESPELDLESFSAKEFISVFGAKNPDLYRLDEEEFTDVAELGSIEDEAIADLVSAEVEVKVKSYQAAGWGEYPNSLDKGLMTFVVCAVLANALALFDDVFSLVYDQQIEGRLGKGKVDYAVRLAGRTVLTVSLFESEDTRAEDAVARTLVLLHMLCHGRYEQVASDTGVTEVVAGPDYEKYEVASETVGTNESSPGTPGASEIATGMFITYGIVTDGSRWWFLECTQDSPGDAGILPCPMFWAGKNPDEMGFVDYSSKHWMGPQTIFARVVKMLETIMEQP